jgi:outer membrane receptor protein involved in Fe transport
MSRRSAIATISQTVDVVGSAAIVSREGTLTLGDAIGGRELEQYAPGGGFQAALRLLASIIEVPGGVSIKGGRPSQAGVQLGAGTLVDPSTGLTQVSLPDDAIDSVAVLPNPYAVEYGRFSSGLVVIQTRRAGDVWKTRLNNLDPTFRLGRSGQPFDIKGIGSFGPRLESGGPILKDRLFLEQTAQFRYSASDVPSRPEDELRRTKWTIVPRVTPRSRRAIRLSERADSSGVTRWALGTAHAARRDGRLRASTTRGHRALALDRQPVQRDDRQVHECGPTSARGDRPR